MTAADELRFLHHVEAADGGVTLVELQERGEDPDGRGLARAVRTEQPDERPFLDDEVDAVERGEVAEAFDETFRDDPCTPPKVPGPRTLSPSGEFDVRGECHTSPYDPRVTAIELVSVPYGLVRPRRRCATRSPTASTATRSRR